MLMPSKQRCVLPRQDTASSFSMLMEYIHIQYIHCI